MSCVKSKSLVMITGERDCLRSVDLVRDTTTFMYFLQELLTSENKQEKKHDTYQEAANQRAGEVTDKGMDVFSPRTVNNVTTDDLHTEDSLCHMDAREEQVAGEASPSPTEAADRGDDQNGHLQWTRGEPPSAATAFTTLHEEVEFKQLVQQEKIARMKAKLKQREEALNSLPSSK